MTQENNITRDAFTVLLPAFAELKLSEAVKECLAKGGCSILLGETRTEYVNRTMSPQRKASEKAASFLSIVNEAKQLQQNLIVAVDQEFRGICRLHDLVPKFPEAKNTQDIQTEDFEAVCFEIAVKAKKLGVNCFLAPILDIVTGKNPWLQGRTWSTDMEEVSRLSAAYVRGIQKAKVISTAKHFPGYSNIPLDPAVNADAIMDESLESIEEKSLPFTKVIQNGVEMIMIGPAIVKAIDEVNPAGYSQKVITLLKEELKFNGIIMSDGLDAKATMLDYTIEEVAVKAIQAGCDFLLLGDIGDQIIRVANAIETAVMDGVIPYEQLRNSADKVRDLANKYG